GRCDCSSAESNLEMRPLTGRGVKTPHRGRTRLGIPLAFVLPLRDPSCMVGTLFDRSTPGRSCRAKIRRSGRSIDGGFYGRCVFIPWAINLDEPLVIRM